ncbi:hypothetical protein TNCV_1855331 [Trichonephila clavipes]|nr:hypothetical protein TNCV_1855331 [Trichonephila clavipes]
MTLLLCLEEEFSRKTLFSSLAKTGLYVRRVPLTAFSKTPDVVELKTSVMDTTRRGNALFRDESKCSKLSDSRRVFPWRENGAHYHPSYVTKTDRFGGKRILVCGGIIVSSRTSLYIFDAGLSITALYG